MYSVCQFVRVMYSVCQFVRVMYSVCQFVRVMYSACQFVRLPRRRTQSETQYFVNFQPKTVTARGRPLNVW